MKRDFLKNLGLSDDQINAIMEENGKDINGTKADYEALKKERDELKTSIAERDKQIGELTTSYESLSKEKGSWDEQLKELTGKVSGYEKAALKSKIAHEIGIPYELANRLTGDDEAALRADAETLAKLVKAQAPIAPLKSNEPPALSGKTTKDQALKNMLDNLTNQGE